MKLKTALFTAAATLAVVPAASAHTGLYGAIGAGLSYLEDDLDVDDGIRPGGTFDSEQNTDNGIGVYAALGKYFGDSWRGEFEISYRNNDARSWTADVPNISAFPEGTMNGDISSYAFMLNVIRDIDILGDWVTPYIGGGVGLAHIDTEIVATRVGGLNGINTIAINDSSRVLAYQGIAGLAFRLAEGLALDLSYRYFGTRNHEVSGLFNTGPFQYEAGYASHSAFAGLRWDFGGAPSPRYKDCWDGSSVPVSSDCPPQLDEGSGAAAEPMQIIVYFDYDKSNLTPEAQALIRETAQRALANNIDTVRVEGNADRSGGSAYNQALSQRRANVVRDALIANGVPADRIDMAAFGEDNPAKPTPDGVREPLNRRTEVRITFN